MDKAKKLHLADLAMTVVAAIMTVVFVLVAIAFMIRADYVHAISSGGWAIVSTLVAFWHPGKEKR